MPFFSVIMPCYNSGKYLSKAVDSVLAQTFPDWELIVVDDGSTDNSLAILNEYQGRLKLLRQTNQGAGTARNLGIKQATGEYLAFLDSDDFWFPWALETLAAAIAESRAEIAAGEVVRFRENDLPDPTQHENKACWKTYRNPLDAARRGRYWLYLPTAMSIRRNVALAVGGYAEGRINGEDTHLVLKLGTANKCCIIESPPLAGYRQHENNSILSQSRGYAGMVFQLEQEQNGIYPGSGPDKLGRWDILTRHSRALSVGCLKSGQQVQAWRIFFRTLGYNFALGRIKYLLAFPVVSLLYLGRLKSPNGS